LKYQKVVFASFLVIVITSFLWRILYRIGDASLIGMVPLSLLIFFGSYTTILGSSRASLDSILSETTRLRTWLKGRIVSTALSLFVTAAGVFLVAYKSLVAQPWEIIVSILCVVTTSLVFVRASNQLQPHVNPRYLLTATSSVTVLTVGTLFFFIYIYSLWNIQTIPEYISNESLLASIQIALEYLPQGIGFVAGLIEIATALEVLKTWVVINADSAVGFMPIIYVVYGAFFGYFQVRVVVAVVSAIIFMLNMNQEN